MAGHRLPHLQDHLAARQGHRDLHLTSLGVHRPPDGEIGEVVVDVVGDLVAVAVDGLVEVALVVERNNFV